MKVNISAVFVLLIVQCCVFVQGNSTATGSKTPPVSTKLTKPSSSRSTKRTPTTVNPEKECEKHNGSCSACLDVSGAKCLYCKTDDSCKLYPSGSILPKSSVCKLSDARWGVCWLNFEALIISIGVIGGVIVMTIIGCCIYCCCCRGNNKKKYLKEEAKLERQKDERKQKSEERRADRKERMDEIRRKYGLIKEDTPYQRFDA